MKLKLFNYLATSETEKNKKSLVLQNNFETTSGQDSDIQKIIQNKYDIIEFAPLDYEKFKPFVSAIDWKTNLIDTADCIILNSGKYKPYNILAEAILTALKKNPEKVNSQKPVIVIGDIDFLYAVVTKLALSGFVEIVVSLTNDSDTKLELFKDKMRSFIFNLNIKAVPIGELTSIEQAGFLLISNFKKADNVEAYEILTYFNFLSEGAVFVDCNSIKDSYLVDDARKAEISVIDEHEIIDSKYNYLVDFLKNSP